MQTFFSLFHLFHRLCAVETACSWSTPTVCWIRTVCVNALQSCRPTWSSRRESWRERGRGAGSKWSRAAPVCTVWVNTSPVAAQSSHWNHRTFFILFPVSAPQSHLSLCSEDQCYGPCCSLGLDLRPQANSTRLLLRKVRTSYHNYILLILVTFTVTVQKSELVKMWYCKCSVITS